VEENLFSRDGDTCECNRLGFVCRSPAHLCRRGRECTDDITDGTYNVEFKVYQDGTSSGGGTLKWTEDRLISASQGVTFSSGTFTVNLGAVNPFGASVDWNQDTLWLSLQVGSTTTCTVTTSFQSNCGGDGEMTPYIRLTAVPQALNSDKLDGLDSTAFGQLATSQTWVGANIIQPSANVTGLAVKQTSFASPSADIFNVQTTNGTNIVQITGPSANTAAVTIASIGGSSGLTLQSGSGTVSLGSSTALSAAGALSIKPGGTATLSLGDTGSTNTIQIGNTTSASTQAIAIGTNTTASSVNNVTIGSSVAGGTTKMQAGATSQTLTNTGDILQTAANSTTAFQVQNSTGAPVFSIDTTTANLLTNPGLEVNTTGWAASGTGASIARNSTTSNVYHGLSSLQVTLGSGAGTGAQITSAGLSGSSIAAGTYTFSFYAKGSGALTGLAVSGLTGATCTLNATTVSSGGFQRYSCANITTTSATTAITITVTTASATLYIDAAQLVNSGSLPAYGVGNIQLRGIINNPVAFASVSNSTTAFQVQNSSNLNFLTLDTLNNVIQIGSATTDNTAILLQLDRYNTSADPTEADGGMYYNTATGNFRCGQAGAWENCIGGLMASNAAASSAVNTCTTACAAFSTTAALPANYCVPGRVIHIVANGVYSTAASATLAMGMYIGTNATTKTSDTLIGTASSALSSGALVTNQPWSIDFTITCFTAGSSGTVNGQGRFGMATSATTADVAGGRMYTATNTTLNTTTAQTIYLFPAWGTSAAGDTATVEQFVVTGM